MLRILKNKRGQNTAEYAILIALVVAAVVGMQTYIKRGIQGRVGDAGDDFTKKVSADANWATIRGATAVKSNQYEDQNLSSQSTQEVLTGTKTTYDLTAEGQVTRDITRKTKQAAGDYQKVTYGSDEETTPPPQ